MTKEEFSNYFKNYEKLSELLKGFSYEEILCASADAIGVSPQQLEIHPMGGYSKGGTSGAWQFTMRDLQRNITHYDWLYERLEDGESKRVFTNLIAYRVLPLLTFLKAAYDDKTPQYFDRNIVSCDKDEVFADCGGFVGDTTEEYIRQYKHYRHIYVYEPSDDNIDSCRNNLSQYENITVRQCGVGEKHTYLSMRNSSSASSFVDGAGNDETEKVEVVSLDEDIQEKVTFIKMDIEGSEISALLGAKKHIRDDFPKLAVCLYHVISDIWEIPSLIDEIHPGYRFYIRHYNYPENWETVLYAIPPEQKQGKPNKAKKRIAAIAFDDGWRNYQLLKDCGIIPYLLYKNHNCDVSMVGGKADAEYPNLDYVKGLKLDFLSDGELKTKFEFLLSEATQIDGLILYGAYESYYPLAETYKLLNPSGRIYLALDANSSWMDRIQWTDPQFRQFMDRCDVIAAAGRTMQKHLNEKWPWPIEHIPNGFYNFSGKKWDTSFDRKCNVILTVGRLGTQQKRTDILLEAFAQIADQIPEWELRLAGGIDAQFEGWLAAFWEKHPDLRARIRFLGNISDRNALYDEYLRAKIFALPSDLEGGTPNVIAEALTAGDVIACTKIDEYQEATDSGRCGMSSEIGDAAGFADVLLSLCKSAHLEEMSIRAGVYAKENFDMEQIVARLNYMLFGGEA